MYQVVGSTIVIKMLLLRHRLWMPICLKIILFLLHGSENPTFLLSFIYTFDIIWPPAPVESCYLARNLKEVARAWYSMRGYKTRGDAGRCCTKAPYYASNERAGEGGLEVGEQVYTWVRPRGRDEIQMLCATQ